MTPEENQHHLEDAELRRHIGEFAFGSDDDIMGEILEMTEEEVDRQLQAEGLEVESRIEALQERVNSAIGRLRLASAHQRRAAKESQRQRDDNWAKHAIDDGLKYANLDASALIARMGQRLQGQDRAVFFRHAQDLSEDDLRQMLVDQDELENLPQDEDF